jgi:hypothetical protein
MPWREIKVELAGKGEQVWGSGTPRSTKLLTKRTKRLILHRCEERFNAGTKSSLRLHELSKNLKPAIHS